MVTFIITPVVTALVTYIITRLYYKQLTDHIRKSVISQEVNQYPLTENIKSSDPTCNCAIAMDPNPAYGTATTTKMKDPAYATVNLLS